MLVAEDFLAYLTQRQVTATTTTAYVPNNWIMRGTTLINVSWMIFMPMHTLVRTCYMWMTSSSSRHAATSRRPAREGKVAGREIPLRLAVGNVAGTIGQLLAGSCPRRENPEQTILVHPFGMGIEDLALARGLHRSRTMWSRDAAGSVMKHPVASVWVADR